MHYGNAAILALSFLVAATIVGAWWPDLGLALAEESSPIAWLQSSLLVACACMALVRATHSDRNARSPKADTKAWSVLALALFAAALDERFMGHERLQDYLQSAFPPSSGATGGPSLILGAVLVAGVIVWKWFAHHLAADARRWCVSGILIGFAAILLDMAFDAPRIQVLEELLEAFAETLFLCGLFTEVRRAASPIR